MPNDVRKRIHLYAQEMKKTIEKQENFDLRHELRQLSLKMAYVKGYHEYRCHLPFKSGSLTELLRGQIIIGD